MSDTNTFGQGKKSNSRFVCGRGRGSFNTRRPYYFRIGSNAGKRFKSKTPIVFPQEDGGGLTDRLQRNEFFTIPAYKCDGKHQLKSITNPTQYPGWRLYFATELFSENSQYATRIKAFEKHIEKYPSVYDLSKILEKKWFNVSASILLRDDEFCSLWCNFTEDLYVNTYNVLSCLGVGMHRVVTSMTVGRSTAEDINCSEGEYKFGKGIVIPKINARPVDFFALSSILNITPECYDKMYVVHGLVSCITVQKTKCTWVAYKCKLCAHEQAIRQKEYPTKPLHCRIQCNCKRSFKELRSSSYSKIEYIEMIRLHEVGMHNFDKSIYIDIEVRRDLVDTFFPGLEITVVGVLKMKPITREKPKLKNYYLQAVCLVNNEPLRSNQKDNSIIQTITMEHNYIGLLVQSLAPEICGYEMVKLAVLLSLFGGSRSHLGDKGELNLLLIADPGLGKSKLLKNAASVSERGRFVSVNEKTNFMPTCQSTRNSIDTGSFMISQTGHCCIDDLEKLSRNQELLIHTMQTKSSSSRVHNKTFKILAKPSIIAAVNPAGVHYDPSKLLRENVQLSPSFLSLFHLVFLICDEADKDQDNTLTEHVKALHSGMKHVLSIPTKYNLELKPNNCNVHSEKSCFDNQQKNISNEHLDLLPGVLLNKYIGYARNYINPLLTEEATSKIKEYYMGLRRGKNKEELFSITTRQLEGLILLTKARARIELSFRVTEQHVDDVINLVRLSRTSTADLVNAKQYGSFLGTSSGSKIKKCIQMLQARCNALSRTTFELEELKDIALHAGLKSDVADVIDVINMQGYLLKKGPNLYEFINNV